MSLTEGDIVRPQGPKNKVIIMAFDGDGMMGYAEEIPGTLLCHQGDANLIAGKIAESEPGDEFILINRKPI